MKTMFLTALFLSLGLGAQTNSQGQAKGYSSNDGKTPPGTFETKSIDASKKQKAGPTAMDIREEQRIPLSSESGIRNSSGVTTDDMNTSPNTPPGSESEMLRDSTLSTGTVKEPTRPGKMQAQDEENALDYSTTPNKKARPKKPNSR